MGKYLFKGGPMSRPSFPMLAEVDTQANSNWRWRFYEFLDKRLDKIEQGGPLMELGDMTEAIFRNKYDILGQLTLGLVEMKYGEL